MERVPGVADRLRNAAAGWLTQCDKLPEPIFTPATKEQSSHDTNISYEETAGRIGAATARTLREATLEIYRQAAAYAATRGIIIADTKFEFGRLDDGRLILIDEVLTPDSSRFWPADSYVAGKGPAQLRQAVRPQLAGNAAVEQDATCTGTSRGSRGRDAAAIHRSIRGADGPDLRDG